jgi:ABC-2 type transport system ATP-binding protein
VEADSADGQPGLVKVTLAQTDARPPEETMNAGLLALIEAGIPLLSYELEGARLSDAFLAMTEAL